MVSIHAPTRGATKIRLRAALRLVVSIHAPARGATEREVLFLTSGKFQSTPPRGGRPNSLQRVCALTWCFNPRPHAGGDRIMSKKNIFLPVSIHAPTRGATLQSQSLRQFQVVSIHAPTRGATRVDTRNQKLATVSIHAPTRGATRTCLTSHRLGCFNPRPHAGGDQLFVVVYCWLICVSIHAPTRGATLRTEFSDFAIPVSIHAPTRGATLSVSIENDEENLFQSTPPRGGRLLTSVVTLLLLSVSIHAPTRGATFVQVHSP